jgi:hypothetical protein
MGAMQHTSLRHSLLAATVCAWNGTWAHPAHICTMGLGSALASLPHLHRDLAHPAHWNCCRNCMATGPAPATSAPGLESPLPHLSRDWGSPLPNLHRDWAHPCRICTGTWARPPTSAPGLGSPHPHLHRDWAHPTHICTGTGLAAATPPTRIRQPGLQLQQAGFPLGPHSLPLSK